MIIDEAHNFRTLIALQQNKKGRIITDACTKCDKVLAMTGTPFVNTPYDIENIMAMISKRGNSQLLEKDFDKLIEDEAVLKDYFNYRISLDVWLEVEIILGKILIMIIQNINEKI